MRLAAPMLSFLKLVLSVYGVILIAELPDKTALATLVLATRHKALPVFAGSAAALAVQSLVAVAAGQALSLLPARTVHVVAGIVFVVAAILMWRRHEETEESIEGDRGAQTFWRTAWTVFLVVFIAEWGDLTQFATAALAARYAAPVAVFLGATAALWSVAGLAVVVGDRAGHLLSASVTQKVASALFAVIGVALVTGLI
jgi:putative Ca2+/H+ antiporter (TMEM165/GDT1 family)